MNAILYSVDPLTKRISEWMTNTARAIVAVYMGLLSAYGTFFLIFMGILMVLISIGSLARDLHGAVFTAFALPIGLSWIISKTARRITWVFIGYVILWMIFLTATLILFLGESPRLPIFLQAIIGIAYLFPPITATVMTERFHAKQTSRTIKGVAEVRNEPPT